MPDVATARAAQCLQQGIALGRGGDWTGAAQALRAAWRADPKQPLAAQGLLECAAQLVEAGQRAPVRPVTARARGAISIVVCSIDPKRLARLRTDLDRELAAEDWELVTIHDARSLSEGYRRGLAQARGELVVLCHDDIGILTRQFAARLRERLATHDLIGVAGCDRLTGPKWFWSGPPHTASWVCEPLNTGWLLGLLGTQAPVVDHAQALDGLFLAGHRAALLDLGLDDATFDGFHFYDLDLSWRAHRAGLRCAIALDLLLWHASGGNFGDSWQHYAQRFVQKFPELVPATPCATYRPGTIYCGDAALIEPIYDWIGHWLTAAEPG